MFAKRLYLSELVRFFQDIDDLKLIFNLVEYDHDYGSRSSTTVRFKNFRITHRYLSTYTFHHKDNEIELVIYQGSEELVVYKSPTFDFVVGVDGNLLLFGDDPYKRDERINWLVKGAWCEYILDKLSDIEDQANIKRKQLAKEQKAKELADRKKLEITKDKFNRIFTK